MTRRERRDFADEFKTQMVQLHLKGKLKHKIIKEDDLTPDHSTVG